MFYLLYAMGFGVLSFAFCIALAIKAIVDMILLDEKKQFYEESLHTEIVTFACCTILGLASILAVFALKRTQKMRSIFATLIGIFSCLFGVGLAIECLVRYYELDKSDINYELNAISLMLTLVLGLILAIFSGLMVYGVRKKLYGCMTPWLVMEVIGTFCGVMNLLLSGFHNTEASVIFWRVCFIVTGLIIWYPVYTLWRDMHSSKTLPDHQKSSPPYESTVVNYSGVEPESLHLPPPEIV